MVELNMNDKSDASGNYGGSCEWADPSLALNVGTLCDAAVGAARVDGAAVSLLTPSCTARELLYATDAVAARIDDVQLTLGQGPCLDAYRQRTPQARTAIGNHHAESPWPLFDDAVHLLGAGAVFAYPLLRSVSSPIGVLALYRRSEGPLDSTQRAAATACAKALSTQIALDLPRHVARPLPATRLTQVPVAAGMVALQLDLRINEALDVLRAHSYSSDRSLSDVADDVVQRRMTFAGGGPTT
jgi:hypothetical protein